MVSAAVMQLTQGQAGPASGEAAAQNALSAEPDGAFGDLLSLCLGETPLVEADGKAPREWVPPDVGAQSALAAVVLGLPQRIPSLPHDILSLSKDVLGQSKAISSPSSEVLIGPNEVPGSSRGAVSRLPHIPNLLGKAQPVSVADPSGRHPELVEGPAMPVAVATDGESPANGLLDAGASTLELGLLVVRPVGAPEPAIATAGTAAASTKAPVAAPQPAAADGIPPDQAGTVEPAVESAQATAELIVAAPTHRQASAGPVEEPAPGPIQDPKVSEDDSAVTYPATRDASQPEQRLGDNQPSSRKLTDRDQAPRFAGVTALREREAANGAEPSVRPDVLPEGAPARDLPEPAKVAEPTERAESTSRTAADVPPVAPGVPAGRDARPGRVETAEPVQARQVIDHLVRAVSLHRFQDKTDLVVKLNPPELGSLSVHVTQDAQGMTSRIQATSETVRGLLQAHLPMLVDALSDAGVRLNSVTVTSDASFSTLMHDSAQGSAQQQYEAPRRHFAGAFEAAGARDLIDPSAPLLSSAGYSWLA